MNLEEYTKLHVIKQTAKALLSAWKDPKQRVQPYGTSTSDFTEFVGVFLNLLFFAFIAQVN